MEAERQFQQHQIRFVKWPLGKGGPIHSSAELSIDSVVSGELNASAADVWARDPETFLAVEPQRLPAIWDKLTLGHPQRDLIPGCIKHGISVKEFIVPFKGKYRQEQFNYLSPPNIHDPNNNKCKCYRDTISREIEQKIAMGAIKVWGRVGTCQITTRLFLYPTYYD